MTLRPGQRLQSAVSEVQVVVVRAPEVEVDLACGGSPMLDASADAPNAASLDGSSGDGPALGKRYADEELGLEVLCSRAGAGALTVDGRPLEIKGAKPLPASD